MEHSSVSQWLSNGAATGAIVSTFLGWTPAVAALVAFVWYMIQIYESRTTQRWLAMRRVRKLARLKARVVLLEAHSHAAAIPPKKPEPDDSGMLMKP